MRAILTYHSIDRSGSPISVSPEAFAGHVRWLASGRVRVLPLEALVAEAERGADATEAPDDAVALTFDDGYANFGAHAAPLLREHGLPATVFVVSRHVGGTNAWRGRDTPGIPTLPLLGWEALGRLHEAGVAVGAHTRTHPRLDAASDAEVADEVAGGADDVAAHLGRRPTAFAYPYGAVSVAAAACVRRHFAVGVTTVLGAVPAAPDLARVPRLDAYYLRRPRGLDAWGTLRFRAYLGLRAAARATREWGSREHTSGAHASRERVARDRAGRVGAPHPSASPPC